MKTRGTPLRYPGGKQKLAPFLAELIVSNDLVGGHYAEPYAGGAGVAIELLLGGLVSHIHLNDCAQALYCFWKGVVEWPDVMCSRLMSAELTVDEWKRHRAIVHQPLEHDVVDVAFSTLYLNRCNRSGVLSGGLIGGLNQTGEWLMDARFRRDDLVERIMRIAAKRDSISVTCLDAEAFMTGHAAVALPEDTLIYCDPPYYERSQSLYLNAYKPDDHTRLAATIQQKLSHKAWVVSYDSHPDVLALYGTRRQFVYELRYSAARSYKGREVFVFSDSLKLPASSSIQAINDALMNLAAG